jgi:cobalamin biosynthesis protein CobD/CbiB
MIWKDYVAASVSVITLCTLLIGGGRVLEQLERARSDVATLNAGLVELRSELAKQQLQISVQAGSDKLREEQINTIRRDLDTLVRRLK